MASVEDRDAKRKRRYAEDDLYREGLKDASRQSYRSRARVAVPDLRQAVKHVRHTGEIRDVVQLHRAQPCGDPYRRRCHTIGELSELVGRGKAVVYRWINTGQLPAPIHVRAGPGNQYCKVYLDAEVTTILKVLAEHFDVVAYYRGDHEDTKERLSRAIHQTRRRIAGA